MTKLTDEYQRGWNDCDRLNEDKSLPPEILVLKERHRRRWWTATHAERLADMADYTEALHVHYPQDKAVKSLSETLRAAANALALIPEKLTGRCPYCSAKVEFLGGHDLRHVNGMRPVGGAQGCEFCNPAQRT